MSWDSLFSPNSIKFNYSWSSSGGMFCERSGSLVCSFQIDIVIKVLIFFASFFIPNNLLNSHIKTFLEEYCVCQQSAHHGLPEIKIPVCWLEGMLWVWTGEIRSVGSWGVCLSCYMAGAALVLPRDPIQSAPHRGQSKGCSSSGTELPLLGVLFAFKLWLFFVSGQIYCRGMLASLLALNSVVLTSLLS